MLGRSSTNVSTPNCSRSGKNTRPRTATIAKLSVIAISGATVTAT